MHLPRHTLESHAPAPLFSNAAFSSPSSIASSPLRPSSSQGPVIPPSSTGYALADPALFACATSTGFLVAQCDPLKVVARRNWSSAEGGLAHVVPLQHSSLLILVGGGRVPRFAPNKVVLWDEMADNFPDERSQRSFTKSRSAYRAADSRSQPAVSRRASTVFSAGSKFDSVISDKTDTLFTGRTKEGFSPAFGDTDSIPPATVSSPSASPPNSLRFSRSSLVDGGDLDDFEALSPSQSPETSPLPIGAEVSESQTLRSDLSNLPNMEASFGASSIGIGRLHSDFAGGHGSTHRSGSDHSPLQSSSASIMASSANLDDPFAFDEPTSRSSPPSPSEPSVASSTSPTTPLFKPSASASLQEVPSLLSRSSLNTDLLEPGPSSQRWQPNTATSKAGDSSLSASDASLASQAGSSFVGDPDKDHAASRPRARKPTKGREVAELEFGEVVRGIRVATVIPSTDRSSGQGHRSSQSRKADEPERAATILVVLLSSKAVIFEICKQQEQPRRPPDSLQGTKANEVPWQIAKRAVVSTYKNVRGLGAVSSHSRSAAIVAVPGRQKGHVQIIRLQVGPAVGSVAGAMDGPGMARGRNGPSSGASTMIVAHESSLAALALSPCGSLLATASSKGTLLRIWSSVTGGGSNMPLAATGPSSRASKPSQSAGRTGFGAVLVRELRRGTDPARILDVAFAPDGSAVAAASDKGTVHIFQLTDQADDPHRASSATTRASGSSGDHREGARGGPASGTTFGSTASRYLPSGLGQLANHIPASMLPQYFKSEWSSAQFRVPLKTFGADSRAPPSSSAFFGGSETDEDGNDPALRSTSGSEPSRTTGFAAQMPQGTVPRREGVRNLGTEKSTDGAWAAMKGRLEDIRKGEPGVDETIFLCWITLPDESGDEVAGPALERREDGRRGASVGVGRAAARQRRFRLIVLTTSGAWYKVSVLQDRLAEAGVEDDRPIRPSGSTVLDMYREDLARSERPIGTADERGRAKEERNALGCTLEEYRRFGESEDGWEV